MIEHKYLSMRMFLAFFIGFGATTGHAAIISRLNRGDNLNIAAIGTSLSYGATSSWFSQMQTWLNSRYAGKVAFYNEAAPGSASINTATYTKLNSGLGKQLGDALTHSPDAIFIEFAINDAYVEYGISQQMSKDNLQQMINQINVWAESNNKTVDIIVQTMNNCANIKSRTSASDRPYLADYYQGYRDVAADNEILLIDHYGNWLNLYNSETDHAAWLSYMDNLGAHPNELGTETVILPEIKSALLAQTTPEPSVLAMLVVGSLGLLIIAWLKRTSFFKKRSLFAIMCCAMAMTQHASAMPTRIMALGDSITAGYTDPSWTETFTFGYRGPLYTRLVNAGYDFQFVGASTEPWDGDIWGVPPSISGSDLRAVGQDGHRGYGGRGITTIAADVVNWLNTDDPDVILLMIGINNFTPGAAAAPTSKTIALQSLVQTIVETKPDAHLIVAQTLSSTLYTDSIVQYNDYIKNTLVPYYSGLKYNVSTVDQYANFVNADGSINTDLYSYHPTTYSRHPNGEGYELMADTWFDGIQTSLAPEPNTSVLLAILGLLLAINKIRQSRLHK